MLCTYTKQHLVENCQSACSSYILITLVKTSRLQTNLPILSTQYPMDPSLNELIPTQPSFDHPHCVQVHVSTSRTRYSFFQGKDTLDVALLILSMHLDCYEELLRGHHQAIRNIRVHLQPLNNRVAHQFPQGR